MSDELENVVDEMGVTIKASAWINRDLDEFVGSSIKKYEKGIFARLSRITGLDMFRKMKGIMFETYNFFENGGGIECRITKFDKILETKMFYKEHYMEKARRAEKEHTLKKEGGSGYKREATSNNLKDFLKPAHDAVEKSKLKSFRDHCRERDAKIRSENEYPKRTGVSCPLCNGELWVESAMVNADSNGTRWARCENKECGNKELV